MKLKVDDQGHAILADGKPVYIMDDNSERPFDVPERSQVCVSHYLYNSPINAHCKAHCEISEKKGFCSENGRSLCLFP